MTTIIATALFILAQHGDDHKLAGAKKEYTARCASCHFVPDTSVRADKVWLKMIEGTA